MAVQNDTFEWYVGASWGQQFLWAEANNTPKNLSGSSARLYVRDKPNGNVLAALTESDGLTLGGEAGTIDIYVSAAVTLDLVKYKRVRIDLAVKPPGLDPIELLYGWVAVLGGPGEWI